MLRVSALFVALFFSVSAARAEDKSIVLAGGCFWGIEAVYQHIKGVKSAVSGYAGGDAATAHYDEVSNGNTGHAEAVKVTYDPAQVSLDQLLDVYFTVAHNPTELNFQGPDHGTQYRSAIFYSDEAEKKEAARKIDQLTQKNAYSAPIVTKLEPLKAFYEAEDYHQDFAAQHPLNPYIIANDAPKVDRLKEAYPALYIEKP